MAEMQSVLLQLEAMTTRITMEAGPGRYWKNLYEAAQIAEDNYRGKWCFVQWSTLSLNRDEFLEKRSHVQRLEAIQLMKNYLVGYIEGCAAKGMTATEIRDAICVTMLG